LILLRLVAISDCSVIIIGTLVSHDCRTSVHELLIGLQSWSSNEIYDKTILYDNILS